MKRCTLLVILFIWLCFQNGIALADEASAIDFALARQYFSELKKISDADSGRLWGAQLYGPTMFINADNRFIVANQPDQGKQLKASDGIYTGILSTEINIANTAIEWSGTLWTMVNWNAISNSDLYDRARLLIHESWHRVQQEIGNPSVTSSNIYLDDITGRTSLILEFRALNRALLASDKSARNEAIADALTIRRCRQSRFADNNENIFERHEGLAEYTGLKLCGLPDSLLYRVAARKLQLGESNDGLANSFPYLTGPALGLLLDQYNSDWRAKVRQGADLPSLLGNAIEWQAPETEKQLQAAADLAGIKYNAAQLLADELAQAALQEKAGEEFLRRLLRYGKLIIPNDNLQFGFNPQEKLIPLDTMGVIYKSMRLTGEFGVLEVTDGILRDNNWRFFIVAAPNKVDGNLLNGEGYSLKLSPEWHTAKKSEAIYIIEKK
jgi:hypothetical protein